MDFNISVGVTYHCVVELSFLPVELHVAIDFYSIINISVGVTYHCVVELSFLPVELHVAIDFYSIIIIIFIFKKSSNT